jgi:hypothetical protein
MTVSLAGVGSNIRNAMRRGGRRGALTGALAVLGAGVAQIVGTERARAGHNTNIAYDSQTVMHLDVTNTTAGSSRISSNISGTAAFVALNNYPVGISRPDGMLGRTMYTTSNCAGVAGTCEAASGGNGVMGTAKASNGCGVYGFAGSVVPSTVAPAGTGVYGSGPSNGLYGLTTNGLGAVGRSSSNFGVYGRSASGGGVLGESDSNPGVVGVSALGTGVYGSSTSGLAGEFQGNVVVTGSLTASSKSAVVSMSDGTARRLYCMEAPDALFEDVGRGKLVDGKAAVKLDGEFAQIIKAGEYEVFLTPYGESRGLYVANPTAGGFDVLENAGGTSSIAFGYRVLAKRKDPHGVRFERVDVPKSRTSVLLDTAHKPHVPNPDATPAIPAGPPAPGSGSSDSDDAVPPPGRN